MNPTTDNQHLIALDFDGVICDSARETGASGWRAARKTWPDEVKTEDPPPEILSRFIRLRPYLHTGYEAIPLMRLAMNGLEPDNLSAAEIEAAKQEVLRQTGIPKEDFLDFFSQTRDDWIRQNEADWLSRNRFYPGAIEALETFRTRHEVFIVTTKQSRFAEQLLRKAGCSLERRRIFGLDTGKKKEIILQELRQDHGDKNQPMHFVEDRLATLRRIEEVPALNEVLLYLCDWGYNTELDRRRVVDDPRIKLLHSLKDLPTECPPSPRS